MSVMSSELSSPAWFPLKPAGLSEVTLIKLDEEAYRRASFLDERLLASSHEQANCRGDILTQAASTLLRKPRPHHIFHIGHVGSTLISRLIGEDADLFSLREPQLLRTFAGAAAKDPHHPALAGGLSLDATLALLSRTWRPGQRAVVKNTSITNEIAAAILAGPDSPTAIFIFVQPLAYLRVIFGGPNSRIESKALAPLRLARLRYRLGDEQVSPSRLSPQSEGEIIAMNWLSEMIALHQAGRPFPSQVHWVNFDQFLAAPAGRLGAIFRALGASLSSRDIETLATGPLMSQYSKAPEHTYDAALRREVMALADFEHSAEIKRGLRWLGTMAAGFPEAKAVIDFAS